MFQITSKELNALAAQTGFIKNSLEKVLRLIKLLPGPVSLISFNLSLILFLRGIFEIFWNLFLGADYIQAERSWFQESKIF